MRWWSPSDLIDTTTPTDFDCACLSAAAAATAAAAVCKCVCVKVCLCAAAFEKTAAFKSLLSLAPLFIGSFVCSPVNYPAPSLSARLTPTSTTTTLCIFFAYSRTAPTSPDFSFACSCSRVALFILNSFTPAPISFFAALVRVRITDDVPRSFSKRPETEAGFFSCPRVRCPKYDSNKLRA